MPRPRSLTRQGIAAAVLAVIDREGIEGLTMRTVAKELGVATMSLYRYVADREELEALVVAHLLDGMDLSLPDTGWRGRLAALLERLHDIGRSHPGVVPLLLRHRHSSAASVRWIEAMLGVLTEAGFTGMRRVIAQRTLVGFVFGVLQNEYYAPVAGAGTTAMSQLSTKDFPLLVETASQARELAARAEFRGGLTIVLDGLSLPDADENPR